MLCGIWDTADFFAVYAYEADMVTDLGRSFYGCVQDMDNRQIFMRKINEPVLTDRLIYVLFKN